MRRCDSVLLFGAALLTRFLVLVGQPQHRGNPTEVVKVAYTLAERGFFGNPFLLPTGPTAHVAPGYPALLAMFVRAFGEDQGLLVARCVTAILISAMIAAMPWMAERLALPRIAGVLAGAVLAIPFFPATELNGEWEAPYAAMALAACVIVTVPRLVSRQVTLRDGVLVGAAWGISFYFAPTLAVVFAALHLAALVAWRHNIRWLLAYGATALVTICLIVTPYLVYVERAIGGFAFFRSNLGLELAVSNNEQSRATMSDNRKPGGGMERHPFMNRDEAARVRFMGEHAYSAMRMSEARAWILAHPRRFLTLTAERIFRFWFPSSPDSSDQATVLLITFVGGVLGALRLRRQRALLAIALAVVPLSYSAIYSLVQADARYVYPVFWLEVLLASYYVVSLTGNDHSDVK